jgi:hypothetical protein
LFSKKIGEAIHPKEKTPRRTPESKDFFYNDNLEGLGLNPNQATLGPFRSNTCSSEAIMDTGQISDIKNRQNQTIEMASSKIAKETQGLVRRKRR